MLELAKLSLVFVFILLLVRKKAPLGLSIILGGFLLGLLFGLTPLPILKQSGIAAIEWTTIHLLIIVLLILTFGEFLKAIKALESLSTGLENLFRSTKLLLILLPALVGLLPMPAGAMMSAPMVQQVGIKRNIPVDVTMVVNYWFRHVLEFFWPLYLGVVMTASLLRIEIRDIILAQLPLGVFLVLGGVLFCTSRIKIDNNSITRQGRLWENVRLTFNGILPVLVVVGLNLTLGIDIALALGITLVLFGLIKRLQFRTWWKMIKAAVSLEMVILILAVMVFKKLITVSGAVETIPNSLAGLGIPPIFAVLTIPFAVGILTGMTSAFIGIAYPVLLAFLAPNGVNYGYMMLAYGAGFMGVMLSPVHLCLVVTKSYFNVGFRDIYRMILPASILLILLSVALVLLGFPWGQIG